MTHPLDVLEKNQRINDEIMRLRGLGKKNREIRAMLEISMGVTLTSKSISARKYRGAKIVSRDGFNKFRQWHVPTPVLWVRKCELILDGVCKDYGANPELVRRMSKKYKCILARHAAIKRIHAELPHMTLQQIGAFFNTDHSSVSYALGRHGSRVCMLERMRSKTAGQTGMAAALAASGQQEPAP